MKAIETRYKGYRFRSRLEARWAVFFERLGIRWEYEPQGFLIGWGSDQAYLPDFRISLDDGSWFWVEVKGDPSYFSTDEGKEFINAIDYGCGPFGFTDSFDHKDRSGSILFLGQIPHETSAGIEVTMIGHHKGVFHWRALLGGDGLGFIHFWPVTYSMEANTDFQPTSLGLMANTKVSRALIAAKSARFEHGEVPA